ncbi:hypothetical protein LSAT2_008058 [Lamellibrachia satsuma]|nr:hypothetical protein LSAT2_008058 [Lamellibrachia satsuma]
MTSSDSGIRGRCRTRAVSRLVNTSRSAPTQIEVVGIKGRRDDRGLSDCTPVKIIKLAVGNLNASNDGGGASPGSLDAWSLCSTPPATQRIHGLTGIAGNSGGSETYPATRVYATRYNTRIQEMRDRTPETLSSSVATNDDGPAQAFAATTLASPRCNNWWTYCAPWGPCEEVHETPPEAGATSGATGLMHDRSPFDDGCNCSTTQHRQPKADIPVYFYDDDKPANLAQLVKNDDWQFGLDGQPRATPVDGNLNDWDCREIRYYYAL